MTDRVVVVTGATGVAGRAVCRELSARGDCVVAVARDPARLESVDAASRVACDLTDAASASRLAIRVLADHGRVDGVVHLVGGWRAGSDDDGWRELEPRLVTSLRLVTIAFRDALGAADGARFAIVGSASAESPTWGSANYSALKAAAEAWVAALASGWAAHGRGAAAVTVVVRSLGEGGTPVERLADEIAGLWDRPAAELNGVRIDLSRG